jgi:hypothetical protein
VQSPALKTKVARVARWHIFEPKIPIWVNFGGSYNGICWYVYFMTIWFILRHFGIFCGFYGHFVYFSPFWYVVRREIC